MKGKRCINNKKMYEIYFSAIYHLQFCNKWITLQYVCELWNADMLLLPQKAMAFCKREGWKSGLHVFAFTHMQDFTCKQRAQEICKPDDMHSEWKIGSLLYSVFTSFIWRLFFTWVLAYLVCHFSLQVFFFFFHVDWCARIRVFCHWLCNHSYFGNVILACIMISSAMLAAEDPLQSETPRNEVSCFLCCCTFICMWQRFIMEPSN